MQTESPSDPSPSDPQSADWWASSGPALDVAPSRNQSAEVPHPLPEVPAEAAALVSEVPAESAETPTAP